MKSRSQLNHRNFIEGAKAATGVVPFPSTDALSAVDYAPAGEFVKDHTFIFHDKLWHLFSISGPLGKGWIYKPGGEETFSHSVSKDLIHWECVGHVLAPGGPGTIDADKIWAPHVVGWNGMFYLFYSGVIHPNWKLTSGATSDPTNEFWQGHRVNLCLATSPDLLVWTKHSATVPITERWGQDPHVLYDEERKRFYLYSIGDTGGDDNIGNGGLIVRASEDLLSWTEPATCLTCTRTDIPWSRTHPTESPFVIRHGGNYYLLLNDAYYVSDSPTHFSGVRRYSGNPPGFAGEVIPVGDRFIRSGVDGERDRYRLKMKEVVFKEGTVSFV